MSGKLYMIMWIVLCSIGGPGGAASADDAPTLVERSFNYLRGRTSYSMATMTIHRPDWERTVKLKAWTRGQEDSMFRIISPPKDTGNGTLKKKHEMWIFNPKVNRVIKLPPSMMSQAWMGSDFSNNDLARSDSLITDYTHTIVGTEVHEGKTVYVIESAPKPAAPVVWGMQRLKIREDNIFLEQVFYDEDLKPQKILTTDEIRVMGGKLFPAVWKMRKSDVQDEYTVVEYMTVEFDLNLPESLFTLSSLRTFRR
jgi:outer membrane lipoprotein-sorting protein